MREGREDSLIFVEGLRLCEEALKSRLRINFVFATRQFLDKNQAAALIGDLTAQNADIYELDEKIFDSLSDTVNSQGILLLAARPETGKAVIERNLPREPLLLLLHRVNNPSNLGAMLRTAEAAGISGIITTKGTTDAFAPKALRGAMGAAFRLPFWSNADFFEVMKWAAAKNIKTVCADIKSDKSYTEINWGEPKLLIFGSEGHGLSEDEIKAADEGLLIPMENAVESLNVAVAGGIILFEAKRQRGGGKGTRE